MRRMQFFRVTGSRKWTVFFTVLSMMILYGCGIAKTNGSSIIRYRYAAQAEGRELLMGNEEFFRGFSQNELEFKLQKKDATLEEYLSIAGEQVLDFTDEETKLLDECLAAMNKTLNDKGYSLPELEEIVYIKTTSNEEPGAGAYTHGTQIYLGEPHLNEVISGDGRQLAELDFILWHELFHCLTRCNPEFRKDMYKLIHFTVADQDFSLPPSVFEYHISNPDVEHHNSYATFVINGENVDCFTDMVTTKHFENEGDTFFDCSVTALVPVDGSDIYYTPEQAENFDQVFGRNTDYVIDPEESMADNFAYAMLYGMDGPEGNGYPDPEIIEGILSYVKAK